MKKIIIIELILCLLCFLANWCQNSIINHFTIFSLVVFNFILCISLIGLFIFLICYFINHKKKASRVISLILLIMAFFFLFYDFRLVKAKIELGLYEKQRTIIIEKIKNNEFSYYFGKNIKLPIYKYVSSDGEVYVYRNDDKQIISFWIFRGVMSGSIELIYSSSDENLIYENMNSPIRKIIKLKDHWYYVVTNY